MDSDLFTIRVDWEKNNKVLKLILVQVSHVDFVLFLKTYLINRVNNQRICVQCKITQKIDGLESKTKQNKQTRNITSGLHLGRFEVLRSSRHYLCVHSQGHHTISRLEERGMGRWSARRPALKMFQRHVLQFCQCERDPQSPEHVLQFFPVDCPCEKGPETLEHVLQFCPCEIGPATNLRTCSTVVPIWDRPTNPRTGSTVLPMWDRPTNTRTCSAVLPSGVQMWDRRPCSTDSPAPCTRKQGRSSGLKDRTTLAVRLWGTGSSKRTCCKPPDLSTSSRWTSEDYPKTHTKKKSK